MEAERRPRGDRRESHRVAAHIDRPTSCPEASTKGRAGRMGRGSRGWISYRGGRVRRDTDALAGVGSAGACTRVPPCAPTVQALGDPVPLARRERRARSARLCGAASPSGWRRHPEARAAPRVARRPVSARPRGSRSARRVNRRPGGHSSAAASDDSRSHPVAGDGARSGAPRAAGS